MIPDKAKAKLDNARELVRLSELYLDSTVRLAMAADARAMSLTGMLVTASTALIAAGFTLLFYQQTLSRINFTLGLAAFGAALCLLGGVWQAISAAKPGQFSVGGNYLRSWDDDDLYGDLIGPVLDQAGIYQEKIDTNLLRLRNGASRLGRALSFVMATPPCAIVFGLCAYFVFPRLYG